MKSELSYAHAIRAAQRQALLSDSEVLIIGLGANDPKGMFDTNTDLVTEFGEDRIMDTPLSENGIAGVCIGLAATGQKPIFVHHRVDFTLTAYEQIINQAAKWFFNSGGTSNLPILIRMVVGRGWGQGPTHAQSLQAMFAHSPGLKIVMPVTPQDAGDMIIGGINDGNPVIYIEHRWLHGITEPVLQPFSKYSIGKGRIVKSGSDFTIVAYSYPVLEAIAASKYLEKKGISCEVIDLKSIVPWDKEIVLSSVLKTKNLLVLDSGHKSFGVGAEIIATCMENIFGELRTKPLRIGWPDFPVPSAPSLSKNYYPGIAQIALSVCSALSIDISSEEYEELKGLGPYDIPPKGIVGPF